MISGLIFSKSGHLTKSPYCVTIRALDTGYIYDISYNLTDTTMCMVVDNLKMAADRGPVLAPLISQWKETKPSNPQRLMEGISSDDISTHRMIQKITFPKKATVDRSAQNYSRIVQIDNMQNISKVGVRFR